MTCRTVALRKATSKKRPALRYFEGLPTSVPEGRVLMHNRVRHSIDFLPRWNGFRAWIDTQPPLGFDSCACGWSGLAHCSTSPGYRRELIDDLMDSEEVIV
jgi:hypothetical protein